MKSFKYILISTSVLFFAVACSEVAESSVSDSVSENDKDRGNAALVEQDEYGSVDLIQKNKMLRLPAGFQTDSYLNFTLDKLTKDAVAVLNVNKVPISLERKSYSLTLDDLSEGILINEVDTTSNYVISYYDSTGVFKKQYHNVFNGSLDIEYYYSPCADNEFILPEMTGGNSTGIIYHESGYPPLFLRFKSPFGINGLEKIILLNDEFFPLLQIGWISSYEVDQNVGKKYMTDNEDNVFEAQLRMYNYVPNSNNFLKNIIEIDTLKIYRNSTLKEVFDILMKTYDISNDSERYYPMVKGFSFQSPIWMKLPYTELKEDDYLNFGKN
jgi:hypothetical protein